MTEWRLLAARIWQGIGLAAQAAGFERLAGRAWAKANSALDEAYEAMQRKVNAKMTQFSSKPKMKIAKEKYLFTRRHRHVYIGRLENDHFKYRLEIGGQGYYFDTLAEVSAFLFGRYGHPKLTEAQLEP